MPIYEFKCASCGLRFENLCSLGETGEKLSCPRCGTAGPARVMSGFSAKGIEKGGPAASGGGGCSGCSSNNCGTCH
ncbi:MAG: FmdB family zinc ribbon protein [Bacillota bacterium]